MGEITTGPLLRSYPATATEVGGLKQWKGDELAPERLFRFDELPAKLPQPFAPFAGQRACSVEWGAHPACGGPADVIQRMHAKGRTDDNCVWRLAAERVIEPLTPDPPEGVLRLRVEHWPEDMRSFDEDAHSHVLMGPGFANVPSARERRNAARKHLRRIAQFVHGTW